MDLVALLLERKKEKEKYFKEPLKYARIIKRNAKKIFGRVEVYLFGSIVKGDFTPSSDIDILIVAKPINPEKRGEIKAAILKSVGFFSPFEIHFATKDIFENWYKKFIKNDYIKI